ncbi:hypothetical protein BJX68DRAFT_59378 [Aspergillus pseudodeflectus]|uniref:Uncharacterized protein n=1 Tax=Aspergillus pseudodeflectus TaxID=176178 RepID=A0ABR4KIM5_9EURO
MGWGGIFLRCLSIVMGTFGQVYFSFVQTFSSFCRVAFLFLGLEDRRHLRLQVVTVRVRTKSSGSTPRIQALSGVSNHSRLRFSRLPPSEVGIRDSLTRNSDLSPWTVKRPIICSIAVKAEIGRRPSDKGPVKNKEKIKDKHPELERRTVPGLARLEDRRVDKSLARQSCTPIPFLPVRGTVLREVGVV